MALYQVQAQFHGIREDISAFRIPLGMQVMGTYRSFEDAAAKKEQCNRAIERPDSSFTQQMAEHMPQENDGVSFVIVAL